MTPDLALAALKSWIESRASAYPVIAGIPILLRDTATEQPGDDDEENADEFDATFIVLTEVSSEEHPVLRGVLTMAVECILSTPAADTDELGKSDAEHRALNAALYHILADTSAIAFCNVHPGFRCWEIRGTAPTTETGEGVRVTTFALSIVGAAVG